jgi:hypothetical protein
MRPARPRDCQRAEARPDGAGLRAHDQDFGTFSLRGQIARRRWTILFYPAHFTFVCATEFAALAAQHERFVPMGCDVVTVSTDTQFVHLAWQKSEKELTGVRYAMDADPSRRPGWSGRCTRRCRRSRRGPPHPGQLG